MEVSNLYPNLIYCEKQSLTAISTPTDVFHEHKDHNQPVSLKIDHPFPVA